MEYQMISTLKKKLKYDIEAAQTNMNAFLSAQPRLIMEVSGDHIDIVKTVDRELEKLAIAEYKLDALRQFEVDHVPDSDREPEEPSTSLFKDDDQGDPYKV